MSIINTMVRNLVVIVIVMTFLEMLLPENKMRSFARFIFGLIIIATILNPIVVFLSDIGRLPFDLSEVSFGTQPQFSDDDEIQNVYNQLTLNKYLENINNKVIEIITPFIDGYKADVKVIIIDDFNSEQFGKLVDIKIFLSEEYQGVNPVKPVVIGKEQLEDYMVYEDGDEIIKEVAKYFQIPDSIITVMIEREEG